MEQLKEQGFKLQTQHLDTKWCNDCKTFKTLEEFRKKASGVKGRQHKCKVCQSSWNKQYAKKPKVKKEKAAYQKAYQKEYFKNPENKVKHSLLMKKHYKENREQYRLRDAERRAGTKRATPKWLSKKHLQEIKNIYWLAKDLEAVSGEQYHVDHIVPIKGKNVCGLNVPWNLQILPSDVNTSKGNRF